jgi:hypothetical protein
MPVSRFRRAAISAVALGSIEDMSIRSFEASAAVAIPSWPNTAA